MLFRSPAAAITSRLSLAYTTEPRGRGTIDTRQMLLLAVEGWTIPRAQTCEWIIDVHVPVNATAGRYRGTITVTVAGQPAAEIALTLEVLDFVLTDNGCRWGAFMTVNPAEATDAWCDINARYGFNTMAWWGLGDTGLDWRWDGYQRQENVLAKLRDPATGDVIDPARIKTLPAWLQERWDGLFVHFEIDEVEGLPADPNQRGPHYRKPLRLREGLGRLTPEQAAMVCYDRPGYRPNFSEPSIESIRLADNEGFNRFEAGLRRLQAYGFAGPLTWFGSGGPPDAWENLLIAQKFGQRYSVEDLAWRRAVTAEKIGRASCRERV